MGEEFFRRLEDGRLLEDLLVLGDPGDSAERAVHLLKCKADFRGELELTLEGHLARLPCLRVGVVVGRAVGHPGVGSREQECPTRPSPPKKVVHKPRLLIVGHVLKRLETDHYLGLRLGKSQPLDVVGDIGVVEDNVGTNEGHGAIPAYLVEPLWRGAQVDSDVLLDAWDAVSPAEVGKLEIPAPDVENGSCLRLLVDVLGGVRVPQRMSDPVVVCHEAFFDRVCRVQLREVRVQGILTPIPDLDELARCPGLDWLGYLLMAVTMTVGLAHGPVKLVRHVGVNVRWKHGPPLLPRL